MSLRGAYGFEKVNNWGAGEIAQMRRLICACVVRIQQSRIFSCTNNFINGHTSSDGSVEPAQMYSIFRACRERRHADHTDLHESKCRDLVFLDDSDGILVLCAYAIRRIE